ncbi:unnamed protein product [Somion occarium]|uniref:Uncharacterized protein n=2 Tax=Somion occarium TaxID=3059160 RepID=A0ABP1CL09_9APHY
MSLRLSSRRILSFISFSSCSHVLRGSGRQTLVTCLYTEKSKRRMTKSQKVSTLDQKRFFHASSPSHNVKDPYAALGVSKDATQADIKKTYFSLARKYHPDTNSDKNAKEKFMEIQEAYDLLKDAKKRAAFDKYGATAQQPGFDPDAYENMRNAFGGGGARSAGGFGGFQDFASAFGGRGNSDLFEQLFGSAFGGGGRPRANVRGGDLQMTVNISFMEACKGTSRTVTVAPIVKCGTCSGTGLRPGAKRTQCTACNGTGTQTFVIDSGFHMASTCQSCHGSGSTVPRGSQCSNCGGVGQVREKKTFKVDIPAGVEDGMLVRVPDAGDAPVSGKGPAGDLVVRVNISASKHFRRQGVNLYHDARIPLHTALLGGKVRVPTLDGEVDVRIPQGTQPGEEMVLKHRGITSIYGGDKGDLFVKFSVQLPRSLTPRQRELLQQYADEAEGRPSTRSGSQDPGTSEGSSSTSRQSTISDGKNEIQRAHWILIFHNYVSALLLDGNLDCV